MHTGYPTMYTCKVIPMGTRKGSSSGSSRAGLDQVNALGWRARSSASTPSLRPAGLGGARGWRQKALWTQPSLKIVCIVLLLKRLEAAVPGGTR